MHLGILFIPVTLCLTTCGTQLGPLLVEIVLSLTRIVVVVAAAVAIHATTQVATRWMACAAALSVRREAALARINQFNDSLGVT